MSASFHADGAYLDIVASLRGSLPGRYTAPGYGWQREIAYEEAARLYATDGLAQAIVTRPADDAVSAGWDVEGDADRVIDAEMDRLEAGTVLTDAARWARLHGGAVVLMVADDEKDMALPMSLARLGQVRDLRAFSVCQLAPVDAEFRSQVFGQPAVYRVAPEDTLPFDVHESRLLRFVGEARPPGMSSSMAVPWAGLSSLTPSVAALRDYRDAVLLAKAILERKQTPVARLQDLVSQLSTPTGKELIRRRLEVADTARGLFTTVAIDAGDGYDVMDSALGGVDAVLREFKIQLAASCGIPIPVLFGEAVAGLNATGKGELTVYHSLVRSVQSRSIRPGLEALTATLWAQRELGVRQPPSWRIVFRPLWSPTEAETAKAALDNANADKARLEALGLLTALVTPEEQRAYVVQQMPQYGLVGDAVPDIEAPEPELVDADPAE